MLTKKIKIPVGLSLEVMHSKQQRKMLETYLIFKAIYDKGYFTASSIRSLSCYTEIMQVSYKTIYKRLQDLEAVGAVAITPQTKHDTSFSVQLCSWDKLRAIFDTYSSRNYYIKPEILKAVKLEYILEYYAIYEKKKEQKLARDKKQEKNGVKNEIKGVITEQSGSFTELGTMAHLMDYLQGVNSWYFKQARTDLELNYNTLSILFGLQGLGSIAYKKRKLEALGLINVQKRKIEFDRSKHTNNMLRSTELGTVHYNSHNGKLTLTMPDFLRLNPLNSLQK